MDRYGGFGAISNLYASPSPYPDVPLPDSFHRYGQLLIDRADNSAVSLVRDADTLAALLTPVSLQADTSIAARLFGGQGRQIRFSLEHSANLIYERGQLHKRHIADINHRHMHMQERLFGAQLHGRLDGYKNAARFEQVLAQLEEQKRREELQFWKDTMEIRDKMFEQSGEYHALRHRMDLFKDLEPVGAPYV